MKNTLEGNLLLISHYLGINQFASLTDEIINKTNLNPLLLVLSKRNYKNCKKLNIDPKIINSFENDIEKKNFGIFNNEEINLRFPNINWSEIIASERSFSDYSFLMGSSGNRLENSEYIEKLLLRMISFFDYYINIHKPSCIISTWGDNIFNNTINILAAEKNIRIILPHVAMHSINENKQSGYLGNTFFLESYEMINKYLKLKKRKLTNEEIERSKKLKNIILFNDHKKALTLRHNMKVFKSNPISNNLKNIFIYLKNNRELNKEIEFYKINIFRKIKANIKRYLQSKQANNFLKKQTNPLPENFLFFPMHFQPEASTLVGGIWHTNQIALIESISKSLPLGHRLIIKEHYRAIGFRPLWQYKHLNSLHNVQFSNLKTQTILKASKLVLSITGTIGIEALAMKKPVIMLGKNFHTYNNLYYKADSPKDLVKQIKRIIIDKDFEKRENIDEEIARFFISYFDSLYDFNPWDNPRGLLPFIVNELKKSRTNEKKFLSEKFLN